MSLYGLFFVDPEENDSFSHFTWNERRRSKTGTTSLLPTLRSTLPLHQDPPVRSVTRSFSNRGRTLSSSIPLYMFVSKGRWRFDEPRPDLRDGRGVRRMETCSWDRSVNKSVQKIKLKMLLDTLPMLIGRKYRLVDRPSTFHERVPLVS